jgi:hypothetical protein
MLPASSEGIFGEGFDYSKFIPGADVTGKDPISFLEELADITLPGMGDINAGDATELFADHTQTPPVPSGVLMGLASITGIPNKISGVPLAHIKAQDVANKENATTNAATQPSELPKEKIVSKERPKPEKGVRGPKPSKKTLKAHAQNKSRMKRPRRQKATLEDNLLRSIR